MRKEPKYPSREFEATYRWLGFHTDTDQRTWYEGNGRADTIPQLRGSFEWMEDRTTDTDWRKWGEAWASNSIFETWQRES